MIRFLTDGISTQVSDSNISSASAIISYPEELSAVTCDHPGNRDTRYLLEYLFPYENGNITIFNINTSYRQVINKVHKPGQSYLDSISHLNGKSC